MPTPIPTRLGPRASPTTRCFSCCRILLRCWAGCFESCRSAALRFAPLCFALLPENPKTATLALLIYHSSYSSVLFFPLLYFFPIHSSVSHLSFFHFLYFFFLYFEFHIVCGAEWRHSRCKGNSVTPLLLLSFATHAPILPPSFFLSLFIADTV